MNEVGITSSAVWVPIITFLLGWLSSLLSDVIGAKREDRRAEKERAHQAEREFAARRHDFQRTTLLAFQDAYARYIRAIGRAQHLDVIQYRQTGTWGTEIPESVSDELFQAQVELHKLTARILDNGVRLMIDELTQACARITLAKSEKQSEAEMRGAMAIHEGISGRLGDLIRALF